MSIKVMTWVWDHSPAAGTDLLMLLAIADQANDAGRDAWPSIKTLAQRTRLDQRTVRRVLKRLADAGHVVIQPGGGRRSNNYEIPMTSADTELSTPLAMRHSGQDATPGASPVLPGQYVRPARTELRQGTVGEAAPSYPSYTRPLPLLPRDEPMPRLHAVSSSNGRRGANSKAIEVLTGLGPAWPLSPNQRRRLTPKVAEALESGWTTALLIEHLGANPEGVKSPAAVLAARLDDLPKPGRAPAERSPWCGVCDETTRHRERDDGRIERCPSCHPRRTSGPVAGEDPARHRRRQAPTPRRADSQEASTPHENNREEHDQCPPSRHHAS